MSRTGFPSENFQKYEINQGGSRPSGNGALSNGPSNGLSGQQPYLANNQQTRMMTHSRLNNSVPPLPVMGNQSPRFGSMTPPPINSSFPNPMSLPQQNANVYTSPPTATGYMQGSAITQQRKDFTNAQPTSLSGNLVKSPLNMTTGPTLMPNLGPPMVGDSKPARQPSLQNHMINNSHVSPSTNLTGASAMNSGNPGNFTRPENVMTTSQSPRTNFSGSTGFASSHMTTQPPPIGQVVGSSGQPHAPPPTQSSLAGPPMLSSQASTLPGKRRIYPNQFHGNSYPSQNIPSAPLPSGQPPSTGAYGSQMSMKSLGSNSNSFMSNDLQEQMGKLSVQPIDNQVINLMDTRNLMSPQKDDFKLSLHADLEKKNAKPNILTCTLSNAPENDSLLKKCKLPFGILVHPFKDLSNLAVIQSSTIVRCRSCRTYINPFVTFVDSRHWKCNMCYRINEVPQEFCYDPSTHSYGEPTRRPEIKSATYEFIAPSEYMLRAPQPAAFVFAFDVSFNAIETGYLKMACEIIKENLNKMPGDSRALVGFLTFNKSVNFYNLRNDQSQPQMLIVSDIDDIFLPAPEDLLVNLRDNKEMITQFLDSLPQTFSSTHDVNSATGAAMQAALKLLAPTGGRVTVFQTTLPNIGPGALENRDEPGVKSSPKDSSKLNPSTDFYKKLALDCAADQVSVDIFQLSGQYADCSSLMCASKYSGGCFSYFPNFHVVKNRAMSEKFENDFTRYLTRKIGFEAVMRVRCTRGLSIHTFHGNFFVRSTDLLSLPNVNPDSAFGMQISIDDDLSNSDLACFQSALLYTSSKGERRIRVHNLALPITKKLSDVFAGANTCAITLMLSKMAVDRMLTASLGDAREALLNAVVDCLGVYKSAVSARHGEITAPYSLRHLPLYILSLMKQTSFRLGSTATLDLRCYELQQFKVMPFDVALLTIYPALYSLHNMTDEGAITTKFGSVPQPSRLLLSAEKLSRVGIFLMDAGQEFYIWVGKETAMADIQCLFGVPNYDSIPEDMGVLPNLDNSLSKRVRALIDHLRSERTNHTNLYILRENSRMRWKFVSKLMNDRTESMMSYYEFLVHIQGQIN